jgi:predicted RNase H-like nuclease (RuvC/YqgF family)
MKKFVAWLFGIETWEAKARIWMDRAIVADMEIGRLTNGQAIQSALAAELEASLEAEKARSRELADLSLQRGKRIEELDGQVASLGEWRQKWAESEAAQNATIQRLEKRALRAESEHTQALYEHRRLQSLLLHERGKVEELEKKITTELEFEIGDLRDKVKELEASECDLTQERDGMRSELKDVKRQHELLHNRLRDIIQLDDEAANTMKARIGELENALSAERARVVEMGKRLREKDLADIDRHKVAILNDGAKALEASLKDRDALIASLEDRLKQAQERIEAEQRCSADFQQWLGRKTDECERLQGRLEEIRTLSYLERA